MITQLRKVAGLFLGLAFIIGHASLAYANGGSGELSGNLLIGMSLLVPGLAIGGYL